MCNLEVLAKNFPSYDPEKKNSLKLTCDLTNWVKVTCMQLCHSPYIRLIMCNIEVPIKFKMIQPAVSEKPLIKVRYPFIQTTLGPYILPI